MATRSSIRAARRDTRLVSVLRCQRARLNCLWSIWYCMIVLAFEIYLTASSIQEFVRYISLPWPEDSQPFTELNAYVGFVGVAVVLLPFFIVAAIFRIGNLANDGFKLGGAAQDSRSVFTGACQKAPWTAVRTVWRHCGPMAPFLHIISAFCLLFPKVLIQAKLIKHGFLHKGDIWRTDLDFMVTHKDRIAVLSILASSNHSSGTVSPQQEDLSSGLGHRRSFSSSDDPDRTFDDLAPISPEFINYAIALLVYSVRYPAVFWETNKPFGFLFSLQLVFGSLQSLLAFTGFAVLYKLNTYGLEQVLPTSDGFLLGRPFAILLYLTSSAIVGLSGSVVYFYGFRKFQVGVVREREKHHISWRESSRTLWGYLPHCLAFAVLVAVAFVTCPLMYDYTVIYKGSLDGAILSCVVGTIMYFFLWIVLWFTLTLKQRWRFRLHPGTSALCNGKVARLPNDFELQRQKPAKNAPLIVISNGQTYTIKDLTPKKAIMSVIHKSAQHHQYQHCKNNADEDDDIYWLKPKPPSPKPSPEAERLLWTGKKKSSPSVKHKVTFEDTLIGGSPRRNRGNSKSPKTANKFRKQCVKFEDLTDTDDDGDYATLKDIPLIREVDEEHEAALEELLKGAAEEEEDGDDDVEKGSSGHQTDDEIRSPSANERHYEDAERTCLLARSPIHKINVAVTVHDESPSPQAQTAAEGLMMKGPDEEHPEVATTRSNSLSSSCSPPEKGSSDTSSGIHSSSSICDNNSNSARKSSSMDDLPSCIDDPSSKPELYWKSLSLQRTPATFAPVRGVMTVVPNAGLDYVGTSPAAIERHRQSTLVLLRKQKRPKTADLTSQNQEPFERDTNMRLTSFTDQGGCLTSAKCGLQVATMPTGKIIAKQKIAPLTIGILTSSPRHLPCTPDLNRSTGNDLLNLVSAASKSSNRQRDSANYSLTSSGDSDNSHP